MATNKKAETRLPAITHAYIDDLKDAGVYGTSASDVIRSLIEAGIRDAIAKGIIKVRRVPKS